MDLARLKKNLVELLCVPSDERHPYGDPWVAHVDDPAQIGTLSAGIQPDGSWPDIDYDNACITGWKTSAHLARLQNLARAWRRSGSGFTGNSTLLANVLRALDYWLQRDFINPNWWWNEIGAPERMGCTALLLEGELSEAQRTKAVRILERAHYGNYVGANLLWEASNIILRACVTDDEALARDAFARFGGEIYEAGLGRQGIKADRSFHQHKEMLYSGGYGVSFAIHAAVFAVAAQDTAFEFSEKTRELLASFYLDGQRWMMRGRTFDYSTVGREITRKDEPGRQLARMCDFMERIFPERREEFRDFAQSIRKEVPGNLTGNKYFWNSDFMVHRQAGFYASVRMLSNRIYPTELCAQEGYCSDLLADGGMFMMRDGKEFEDVFPVWNWRHVPGITAEQAGVWFSKMNNCPKGLRDFVGGVSDGSFGVTGMDFERGALKARKAWFFRDDRIVCLGAGISCGSEIPIHTSVNQCLLRGPVFVRADGKTVELSKGRHGLKEADWVFHDKTGYVVSSPRECQVLLEKRCGNYSTITERYGDCPASADVFDLWIDHAIRPQNATYAYTIFPNVSLESLGTLHARSAELGSLNTSELQAVWEPKTQLVQAVFWNAGALTIAVPGELDLVIACDMPCFLMFRRTGNEALLSVASPIPSVRAVTVSIHRWPSGASSARQIEGSEQQWRVDLPSGEHTGQSVVRRTEADRHAQRQQK